MSTISDNFNRPNGALGNFWGTVIPNAAESMANALTGGVAIRNGAYGPISGGGGDAVSLYTGGLSFGNDQWAQCTIKTVANPTATLAISQAVAGGGFTNFTYTITSGDLTAAKSSGAGFTGRVYFVVSGMNAGNNGPQTANDPSISSTVLGSADANGFSEVTAGTAYCPSDSVVGVGIRLSGSSAATLNGYFFEAGTNSFSPGIPGDGRISCYELWKVVNGVGTSLGLTTSNAVTLPSPGDIIALKAVGTTLTAYVNGFAIYTVTDATHSAGVPGLWCWSMSGPQQYHWDLWPTVANPPGNNGTSATSFVASDTGSPTFTVPSLNAASVTDSLTYANGDLHTLNNNWVYQTGTFQISSNKCYSSAAGVDNTYRSDFAPGTDQWAKATASLTAVSGTQNGGPAVKMSTTAQTFYAIQAATNILRIVRYVAGVVTTPLNADASLAVTGDVLTIIIRGNTLWLLKNGVSVGVVVDYNSVVTAPGSIAGNTGFLGAANAVANGYSVFSAGNTASPTFPSGGTSGTGLLLRGVG